MSPFPKPSGPAGPSRIRVALASSDEIRRRSGGEVSRADTVNYQTFEPVPDGLFCPRIFGPVKDYRCSCKRRWRAEDRGSVCGTCGVEIGPAGPRRERMGHVELASPVVHAWFMRARPSPLCDLLGLAPRDLERVVFFNGHLVLDGKDSGLRTGSVVDSETLRGALSRHGPDGLEHGEGAEAVRRALRSLDLRALSARLRAELETVGGENTRKRLIRRLRVAEGLLAGGVDPASMVMTAVPVMPPDLRPLVPLADGRLATSDLNDLYRLVVTRNDRLRRIMEHKAAPGVISVEAKRMLQEAVDALLDHGRRGRAVGGPDRRRPWSITDLLRGERGRFRRDVSGKRVDYSGSAPLVADPSLPLGRCGLPIKMALELFRPFVYRVLGTAAGIANVRMAKRIVDRECEGVPEALRRALRGRLVLLNRPPAQSRLGIRAFEPVLVDGGAITLNPLEAAAFGEGALGGPIIVHLPISRESQAEARALMADPGAFLFNPADGAPAASPRRDAALGIRHLTLGRPGAKGEGLVLSGLDEVRVAHDAGALDLQARIVVRLGGRRVATTCGRALLYDFLPASLTGGGTGGPKDGRNGAPGGPNGGPNGASPGGPNGGPNGASPDVRPGRQNGLVSFDEVFEAVKRAAVPFGEAPSEAVDRAAVPFGDAPSEAVGRAAVPFGEAPSEAVGRAAVPFGEAPSEAVDRAAVPFGEAPSEAVGRAAVPFGEAPSEAVGRAAVPFGEAPSEAVDRAAVPFEAVNKALDEGDLRGLVVRARSLLGPKEAAALADGLQALGFRHAAGLSLRLSDFVVPRRKAAIVASARAEAARAEELFGDGLIGEAELLDRVVRVWTGAFDEIAAEAEGEMRAAPRLNPLLVMAESGAAGSRLQTGRLSGMLGLMAEPGGGVIEPPVTAGLREGLSPAEFLVSAYAARRAGADRAMNGGPSRRRRLTRRLVDAAQDVVVTEPDCGASDGIEIGTLREAGEVLSPLSERLAGRVAARDVFGRVDGTALIEAGRPIGDDEAAAVERGGHDRVLVRSPVTCRARRGVCAKCYGLDLARGAEAEVGEAVGVVAAQAVGEAAGKLAGTDSLRELVELFEARGPLWAEAERPSGLPWERPAWGSSEGSPERRPAKPPGAAPDVGAAASNPAVCNPLFAVVPDALELARRLVDEVRRVCRLQGVRLADKHVEVIARSMLRKVRVTRPGDTGLLSGERVDRLRLEELNRLAAAGGGTPAEAEPLLQGVTEAALSTGSLIAEASVQDPAKVLTGAALSGRADPLEGIKENVIIGRLIPVGTGLPRPSGRFRVEPAEDEVAPAGSVVVVEKEPRKREGPCRDDVQTWRPAPIVWAGGFAGWTRVPAPWPGESPACPERSRAGPGQSLAAPEAAPAVPEPSHGGREAPTVGPEASPTEQETSFAVPEESAAGPEASPAVPEASPAEQAPTSAVPEAAPVGPEESAAGPEASPAGLEAAPTWPEASPAGPESSHVWRVEASPAGLEAAPAGPEQSPAELEAAPVGQEASLAGPETAFAEPELFQVRRESSRAEPEPSSATPESAPVGREESSARPEASPAGPERSPAEPETSSTVPEAAPDGP